MKISLLLQREPFGEILEKTLASFLADYYQKPYQVKWYSGYPKISKIIKRGEQPWLCNPGLNAIFEIGADSKVFDPVKLEFSTHPSPWRTHIQRVYVKLATGKAFRKWFSSCALGILPPVPDADSILIVGGNHKIRIINHKTKTVYVILKKGFDGGYIQRELAIRQKYGNLPIPPLQEVSADGTWFSENYINGTPVNRLKDKKLAASVVGKAAESLYSMLRETAREERVKHYADSVAVRVRTNIEANHLLNSERKQSLFEGVDAVLDLIDKFAASAGDTIFTAQAHGDFQPGNILYDNGRVWLIDWEYTGRRQAGYDAMVFSFQSRFPNGLAERVSSMLKNNNPPDYSLLNAWPHLDWKDKDRCRLALGIFLLEDLDLLLEENQNSYFRRPSVALIEFQNEMKNVFRILENG